jgi:hypothetical protein
MIGHHFSASALTNTPSASGVLFGRQNLLAEIEGAHRW